MSAQGQHRIRNRSEDSHGEPQKFCRERSHVFVEQARAGKRLVGELQATPRVITQSEIKNNTGIVKAKDPTFQTGPGCYSLDSARAKAQH